MLYVPHLCVFYWCVSQQQGRTQKRVNSVNPRSDSGNKGLYLSLMISLGLPVLTRCSCFVSVVVPCTLSCSHIPEPACKLYSEKLVQGDLFWCLFSLLWKPAAVVWEEAASEQLIATRNFRRGSAVLTLKY